MPLTRVTGQDAQNSATANMTTTGLSATAPSAPTSGNLGLAVFGCRGGSGRTITPPASPAWTLIPSSRLNNGTNTAVALYYRAFGASESATQGAWTLDSASVHSGLVWSEFNGHDGAIIYVGTISGATGFGTTQNPSVTGLTSGTTYGLWAGYATAVQTTYTQAGTMTESGDVQTTGGSNVTVSGAYELAATGSTSYARQATAAGSGNYASVITAIAITVATFNLGTGQSDLSFASSGNTLIIVKPLGTAQADMLFGASGNVLRYAGMTGTSALTFGGTADLLRIVGLTGSSPVTFVGSGSAVLAPLTVAGSSAIIFGATATLNVSGSTFDMGTGTAVITMGASGDLTVRWNMTGQSDLSFGQPGGLLTQSHHLVGSVPIAMGMTGDLFVPTTSDIRSRHGRHGTMGRVDIWVPVHSRPGVRRA